MNVYVHTVDGKRWFVNDVNADAEDVTAQIGKGIKLLPVVGPQGAEDMSAGYVLTAHVVCVRAKVKE